MMNYYHSILFTCLQNVNQTRNRITHIYPFPYLPVSVPGTRPFRNLGPCLPFAGVAGVWVWVASLAGRGGLAAHGSPPPCPWSPRLAHLPALPHPPTPGSRPGRPAPTCAQLMCHARGQGTNNVSQSLMYIDTKDHSRILKVSQFSL